MIIDCAHYQDGRRTDERGMPLEEVVARRATAASCGWGCTSRTKAELDHVREVFGLHELAVEDALSEHMRPKIERTHGVEFSWSSCVPRAMTMTAEEVEFGEISVFPLAFLRHYRSAGRGERATRRQAAA